MTENERRHPFPITTSSKQHQYQTPPLPKHLLYQNSTPSSQPLPPLFTIPTLAIKEAEQPHLQTPTPPLQKLSDTTTQQLLQTNPIASPPKQKQQNTYSTKH
jgi:hypothetical protein